MKSTKIFLLFFLSLLVFLPLNSQLSSKEIDHLVDEAMEKFTVAGVAVGIVKDGEIVHARGLWREIGRNRRIG